ncbi:hypothetical protein YC2023_011997 [Brassica napus]
MPARAWDTRFARRSLLSKLQIYDLSASLWRVHDATLHRNLRLLVCEGKYLLIGTYG